MSRRDEGRFGGLGCLGVRVVGCLGFWDLGFSNGQWERQSGPLCSLVNDAIYVYLACQCLLSLQNSRTVPPLNPKP